MMFRIRRHPAEAPRYAACYEPTTLTLLTVAATALAAVGGVVTAVGQQQAADNAADQAKQAAAENARRQSIEARKRIGLMRANYGASGVTVEGSPLDILEESARNAELDRLTILQGGQAQADYYKAKGQSALYSGIGSAASDLLIGGVGAYDSFTAAEDAKLKRVN